MKSGMIAFKKDWRRYLKGQIVDPVETGIGWGLADVLVAKGFATYHAESEPGYTSAIGTVTQTMTKKRPGRPVGSKNRPKVDTL